MAKSTQVSELEMFRNKVQENELVARFNKSEHDKMFYYLEAKKIAPAFLEEAKKDEAERAAMQEELISSLKSQVATQNNEVVPIDSSTDTIVAGSDGDIDRLLTPVIQMH